MKPLQKPKSPLVPVFLVSVCLAIMLYHPALAEDGSGSRMASDDPAATPGGMLSTPAAPSARPIASVFSLSLQPGEIPYAFEIQSHPLREPQLEAELQVQMPGSPPPNLEKTLYASSLITLTALNIADIITTVQALKLEGLEEGNPVMQPVAKNAYLFSAVKLGVAVMDYYLLKKLHKKNRTLGWVASLAANLAMSYVVANNIRKMHEARVR